MITRARASLFRILCICLLAFAPPSGGARGGEIPPGRIAFRSYGSDQGLGNQAVWALAQDPQGFLWAGTEDGLYRYDGNHFSVFSVRHGLPSSYVRHLHMAPDGTLWAGTFRGAARLVRGSFEAMGPEQGLPLEEITGFASSAGNTLWVATLHGPYVREGQGAFHEAAGWPGGSATALWSRPGDARVWAASWNRSRSTLLLREGGAWRSVEGPEELHRSRIDALAEDGQGWVWARSLRGLWVLYPGESAFKTVSPALPQTRQRGCLYVDPQGHLWVTSVSGLLRWEGKGWRVLGKDAGLPMVLESSVLVDREGSLWMGGYGVHRMLGAGVWSYYDSGQGLAGDYVWGIFRDREGNLYAGTDNGLARAEREGWRVVPEISQFQVRSIAQGPDGAIYVTGGAEVLRWDPRRRNVERYGPGAGVTANGRIFGLRFDRSGTLWVGTDGAGLLRGQRGARDGWTFTREEIPGGGPHERIRGLHEDPQGRFWVTGDSGLAMRENGVWHRFTTKDGLRADNVSYVCGLRDGGILLAYFDPLGVGRVRYEGGRLSIAHLDAQVPVDRKVYQLGEDTRGNLWVGTGQGMFMIHAQGGTEYFGCSAGMVSEDTNAMAFMADAGGDVWVGTGAGLARFDASAYRGLPAPPETVILSWGLGDRKGSQLPGKELAVPYTANVLEARFAGVSFIREGSVTYQVRLVGLEKDWHAMSLNEVRYPALPHGAYTFEVRSAVGGGPWGPVSRLPFSVLPAWWQTWWFRTLLILATGGLVFLVFRWRIDALRRRNRHLEDMVADRTREVKAKAKALEEANEALRNQSLTDPLTGLRNRRYLGTCIPGDIAQVNRRHRDHIKGRDERNGLNIDMLFAMVDVDFFKSVNDQHGHAAGDRVLQQVADILRRATRDSDTVVRWGGEEFLVVARNTARREATTLVERIRSQMENHAFDLGDGQTLRRTCSLGFAFYPFLPEQPDAFIWEQVVDLADHCLYAAKRGGRNAWVGLFPGEGAEDPSILTKRLPLDIRGLLQEGRLQVITNHPDPASLDWDMHS